MLIIECTLLLAQCLAPTCGNFQCPNGPATSLIGDTCTFSCNAGYELQGSNNGICLANQSWSGGDPICEPLRCSDVTMGTDDIITSPSCDMTYRIRQNFRVGKLSRFSRFFALPRMFYDE